MEEETLIDLVQKEMLSDDVDRSRQSDILRKIYEDASKEMRDKIDQCFICLCGWSLKNLLNR